MFSHGEVAIFVSKMSKFLNSTDSRFKVSGITLDTFVCTDFTPPINQSTVIILKNLLANGLTLPSNTCDKIMAVAEFECDEMIQLGSTSAESTQTEKEAFYIYMQALHLTYQREKKETILK